MENISEILELHKKWLFCEHFGKRADLRNAELSSADLRGADLCDADLRGAHLQCSLMQGIKLRGANMDGVSLFGAFLQGADLTSAIMRGADLNEACLQGAYLHYADLQGARLEDAHLEGAQLWCATLQGASMAGAFLQGADLRNTDLQDASNVPFIPLSCPDSGQFIGWKKCGKHIVKLRILEDSKRNSSTGSICRCDKAEVLEIQNVDGSKSDIKQICSDYDNTFYYVVGKIARVDNFCEDRFLEYGPGIHFFINRQEAAKYIT